MHYALCACPDARLARRFSSALFQPQMTCGFSWGLDRCLELDGWMVGARGIEASSACLAWRRCAFACGLPDRDAATFRSGELVPETSLAAVALAPGSGEMGTCCGLNWTGSPDQAWPTVLTKLVGSGSEFRSRLVGYYSSLYLVVLRRSWYKLKDRRVATVIVISTYFNYYELTLACVGVQAFIVL